jgi:hypothetical protein
MRILSPDRPRTRPRPRYLPPSPPPPQPPRDRGNPWGFLTVLVVLLFLVGGFFYLKGLLPSWDNPFESRTVDRSQPALLQSIEDIGEYRAATGNYQVVIDLEHDTGLPSAVLGSRTLFVAKGTVDAGVDLSAIGSDDVKLSDDGTSATITLPHAKTFDPELDVKNSYVYDRDEGLFNRIGGVFSTGNDYEHEAYVAASKKLDEAASQNGDLARRAEENTATMLESLAKALGIQRVDVRFVEPASGTN